MDCCLWALRRPLAAFATNPLQFLKPCNPIGQAYRLLVASIGLPWTGRTCGLLSVSAQTAFGRHRYLFSPFLKSCDPIGQIHNLPVASVWFILSRNKVNVDLPLGLRKYRGKFGGDSYYRDWMHSEQTNKLSSLYISMDDYIKKRNKENKMLFWKKS